MRTFLCEFMRYLLDTNIISDLYNKKSDNFPELLQAYISLKEDDELFVSVLTLHELEYGYEHAPKALKRGIRQKISNIKDDFVVLPLTEKTASLFGKLKSELVGLLRYKKNEAKKHVADVIIAAQAISESCVLVSNDSIYPKIHQLHPELTIENWVS